MFLFEKLRAAIIIEEVNFLTDERIIMQPSAIRNSRMMQYSRYNEIVTYNPNLRQEYKSQIRALTQVNDAFVSKRNDGKSWRDSPMINPWSRLRRKPSFLSFLIDNFLRPFPFTWIEYTWHRLITLLRYFRLDEFHMFDAILVNDPGSSIVWNNGNANEGWWIERGHETAGWFA